MADADFYYMTRGIKSQLEQAFRLAIAALSDRRLAPMELLMMTGLASSLIANCYGIVQAMSDEERTAYLDWLDRAEINIPSNAFRAGAA